MRNFEHIHRKHSAESKYLVGFIFIIVGALLLGRNFHIIPHWISNVFISWQMLLIVIGIVSIFVKKKPINGLVLIGVGGIFLANKFFFFSPFQWQMIWPAVFVFIGVLLVSNVIGDRYRPNDFDKYRGFDIAEAENDDFYGVDEENNNTI